MNKNSETKVTCDEYSSHLKNICNSRTDEANTQKSHRIYVSHQNMRNIRIIRAAQSLKSHNEVISMLLTHYFKTRLIEVD